METFMRKPQYLLVLIALVVVMPILALMNLQQAVQSIPTIGSSVTLASQREFTYLGVKNVYTLTHLGGCNFNLHGPNIGDMPLKFDSCDELKKKSLDELTAFLQDKFRFGNGLVTNFWHLCAQKLIELLAEM